ncbi:MAG TPA: NADH-quinone oxidoreductase subunit NuoH [Candidatus Baltobacteraceae bacterium]|nr:NADH-quinone oxidoreductase subunit NuoH [Candidatus Baltobacteraceae bacterium]
MPVSLIETLAVMVAKVAVVFGVLLLVAAYMTWVERKVIADMQVRWGPTRVGPFGLLQPIADGIKLFFKEDLIPSQVDRVLFLLAPALSVIPAMIAFAVIPFGGTTTLFGLLPHPITLQITDIDVGVLYVFGITSLGVYGIVLAGWASNNKYSLLGGLRSSAQMISYELSMSMSVVGVLLMVGSLRLSEIVRAQSGVAWWLPILPVPNWFLFSQPLGFIIFFICALAETNRAPFDLPEAETELVAGFHSEYSSMKFAMFFMAEYANMATASAMATTLFLGGPDGPFGPSPVWFVGKVFLLLFIFIWLRASLPRFRYDQLMTFGWKRLLPLTLVNLVITAVVAAVR